MIQEFAATLAHELDDFQVQAIQACQRGENVLVSAPTGSGKTIVAEFIVYLGLATGQRVFYTTPIKALSNQKYRDLVNIHGSANVGLLTGDTVINGDAQVVVMTAEVLRNMLYEEDRDLSTLGFVILDEVHFLADRYRGSAWEEIILQLPLAVKILALSATLSNIDEFGAWWRDVRGSTAVVVSHERPVPLIHKVIVNGKVFDLFGPKGKRLDGQLRRYLAGNGQRIRRLPRFTVTKLLAQQRYLPAIYFIFSRQGCDDALGQELAMGTSLLRGHERAQVEEYVLERIGDISDADLATLGFDELFRGLQRGMATHHAGMLPLFKEIVEELFARGLVKLVFATETLALGINMPALSVIVERLDKWDGHQHVTLTPAQFTQLTGRAGRRGKDDIGYAITVADRFFDADTLHQLASTASYPLVSSFSPSYNMAANIVALMGYKHATEFLERSFAQFATNEKLTQTSEALAEHETAMHGYAAAMACDQGDIGEYLGLQAEISERQKAQQRKRRQSRTHLSSKQLDRLRVGEVLLMGSGRAQRRMLVVHVGKHIKLLNTRAKMRNILHRELANEPASLAGYMPGVDKVNVYKPKNRQRLAEELQRINITTKMGKPAPFDPKIDVLRQQLATHPVHSCEELHEHLRWGYLWRDEAKRVESLQAHIAGQRGILVKRFDAICRLLSDWNYLDPDYHLTEQGEVLRGIYSEHDLLITQCLWQGVWNELKAPELVAVLAAIIFEPRTDEKVDDVEALDGIPERVRETLQRTQSISAQLRKSEYAYQLQIQKELDFGIVEASYEWARGQSLANILLRYQLTAGDFVRHIRQIADLAGQVQAASKTTNTQLAGAARAAIDAIQRDILTQHSVTGTE